MQNWQSQIRGYCSKRSAFLVSLLQTPRLFLSLSLSTHQYFKTHSPSLSPSPSHLPLFLSSLFLCVSRRRMMETQEEYQAQVIKGKRTKRHRPPSPLGLHMVSSSSSTAGDAGGGMASDYSSGFERITVGSPATSAGVTESSTEEEDQDMANCLILLAQGRGVTSCNPVVREKAAESLYVYQCKTCDRCFPSFQALGGHRASHKKPKNNALNFADDHHEFRNSGAILSLQTPSGRPPPPFVSGGSAKPKVHECSICGAEFSSGQALGGHMRRHRALTTTAVGVPATGSSPQLQELMMKKERNVLELDLNLPAPEDDRHRTVTVFSAASLVDCLH